MVGETYELLKVFTSTANTIRMRDDGKYLPSRDWKIAREIKASASNAQGLCGSFADKETIKKQAKLLTSTSCMKYVWIQHDPTNACVNLNQKTG